MKYIEDKYFIAISDYIKNVIEEKNIDISDLAAAANVDRKQVYRLINKENVPKLSTLIRISLAAGIEPQILFSLKFDFEFYMKENNILKATPKTNKKS
ncbi:MULTISPECIES: helix-turn-helix transcriptional regulator [Chryseobacterium]|uniref:helix-turn-helix domain-containing protein n=1 Tax=Chryseobacterium TaxID=59732 RepID=UPI0009544D47|nr:MULTISPECIES: helix-turn-helix transcriptional regulator [Chryseobacterium]MDR6485717.1 plasmid maintenance system antidote protein VapI [Chryseobacterium vietnamense]SIR48399.1 Helix-turn-helix [Chryseobacterium sp. RU33C]